MTGPMRLLMNRPGPDGITTTIGTELFTPEGGKVTGIQSIEVRLEPNDVVRTTVVLSSVIVEYRPE